MLPVLLCHISFADKGSFRDPAKVKTNPQYPFPAVRLGSLPRSVCDCADEKDEVTGAPERLLLWGVY